MTRAQATVLFLLGGMILLAAVSVMLFFVVPDMLTPDAEPVLIAAVTDTAPTLQPASTPVSSRTPVPTWTAQFLPTVQPSATRIDTPLPTDAPLPTSTPIPQIPDHIRIPAIKVDAPVVDAVLSTVNISGTVYRQWSAPNELAAGWFADTATLGRTGGTVIDGHNNIFGSVFRDLYKLKVDDIVEVFANDRLWLYSVRLVMILPERGQAITIRLSNARWVAESTDERLTLISCWPPWSNTHRVVVVAVPFTE